jgi:hypothetical protein
LPVESLHTAQRVLHIPQIFGAVPISEGHIQNFKKTILDLNQKAAKKREAALLRQPLILLYDLPVILSQ